VFIVFLVLFVYSIYIVISCTNIIRDYNSLGSDQAFKDKYGKTLKDVTKVYVINMVVMVLSLIVLVFFLHKALPVSMQAGLFNDTAGGIILLYVFVVSAWTLAMFNQMKDKKHSTIAWFSAIILVVCLVAMGISAYRIYENVAPTVASRSSHSQHAAKQQHAKQQHAKKQAAAA
jgi:hypothetical protein